MPSHTFYNEVDAGYAAPGTTRLPGRILRIIIIPKIIVIIFRFGRWWVSRYIRQFHFSFSDIHFDGRCCENGVIAAKHSIIWKEVNQAKPFQKLANTDVIPQTRASYSSVDKAIVVDSYRIFHGAPGILRLLLKPLADFVIVIRSFGIPACTDVPYFPLFHD